MNKRSGLTLCGLLIVTVLFTGCWGGADVDPSGARRMPNRPGSSNSYENPGASGTYQEPNGGDVGTYELPDGAGTTGANTDLGGVTSLSQPMDTFGGDADIVRERRWVPVYFAYNQSVIGETEREKLSELADYLVKNARYVVVVEGHCDSRGSEEYNRGLGERRAISVKDYLVSLGVAVNRIRTLSYGEERPADPGNSEAAHARNRRAEFVILLPKE